MGDVPRVSVCVLTYQHAQFVAQALASVLAQVVDFPVEIVCADDASTDGTRDVLRQVAADHPGRVKLILHEANVGPAANFISVISAARGRYVAYLDGDDYWTAPDKLSVQARFLDTHPDFSLCFHNVLVEDAATGDRRPLNDWPQRTELLMSELLRGNPIASCSFMYRNGLLGGLPGWYASARVGDWLFHLLHGERGRIGYTNRVMGVYRQHRGSSWSSQGELARLMSILDAYDLLERHLSPRHGEQVARERRRILMSAVSLARASAGPRAALELWWQGVRHASSWSDALSVETLRGLVSLSPRATAAARSLWRGMGMARWRAGRERPAVDERWGSLPPPPEWGGPVG